MMKASRRYNIQIYHSQEFTYTPYIVVFETVKELLIFKLEKIFSYADKMPYVTNTDTGLFVKWNFVWKWFWWKNKSRMCCKYSEERLCSPTPSTRIFGIFSFSWERIPQVKTNQKRDIQFSECITFRWIRIMFSTIFYIVLICKRDIAARYSVP